MSESFFGLRKRPFAALPNVDCFVPLNGICQAYDGLLQTTLEGRGIGMLTAPAGLGKTLVCQRLARELSNRFSVVFLPSGNFLTRRSLLQAILFELGHSFVRMGDQELRLALSAMLQAIRPTRQGLVLIVDEAHLMATRMLEELRALLNLGEGDEPLVRLIVSGQLGLEETLSRPQCDAFNQRIACQVMLPSLTRDESTSYITRRLAWAGANVSEVFARDALAAICEASDGVPRCLHQLADHCLTLATNRTEKPINLRTVREALDHLKQLPLTWAEPTVGRGTTNPLEMARAQAAAVSNASSDLDGPMCRPMTDAAKANRLDEMLPDTYPLQADRSVIETEYDVPTVHNSWELDSESELVSPSLDHDSIRRVDSVINRDPYTGVADNDGELIDTIVPAVVGSEFDLGGTDDFDVTNLGGTIEFGDSIEVESNEAELNEIESNEPVSNEIASNELVSKKAVSNSMSPVGSLPTQTRTVHAEVLPEIETTIETKPLGGRPATPSNYVTPADVADDMVADKMVTEKVGAAEAVDEEVVIDRYAALDSAINRLTRTMLTVRANARTRAAEPIVLPEPPASKAISLAALDAVHQRFDVVLPEDDPIEVKAPVLESSRQTVSSTVATAVATPAPAVRDTSTRSAADERRPYQLLFSELRRKRRRV
jgi:type II secretory pathway predicted ATPase ExeA